MKELECRKRVVVTGGASGIGLAMSKTFAKAGHRVAIIDKTVISDRSRRTDFSNVEIFLSADITSDSARKSAMAAVFKAFQGIDVLLNNAGISLREPALHVTSDSWDAVMDTNIKAAFFMAQESALIMLKQDSDSVIINTASVSGMVAMPNYISYNISKAGVIEMTKCLALELAPRIRVNSISPGYISTPMQQSEYTTHEITACAEKIPLKRLGEPQEVADLAFFLASQHAKFATGHNFVIDGGETVGGLASA
ncbi:SDR family oxidoreductase [Pseudomonas sp. RP23018S]|uniref:SDR family NAD(P)-dependent oxidoreductase n=1 Tax=Pseudomonas sp. RP23018S TaxID=3096037 RepID=UPI002ACAF373|nr:SDR family oxidoreductase [Pseudomonas sp. RP23018S]MDZ5601589.1 SDR family oxidoreductase [Pseudomonas sp. RP23018S]